jgi:hypothetical protein
MSRVVELKPRDEISNGEESKTVRNDTPFTLRVGFVHDRNRLRVIRNRGVDTQQFCEGPDNLLQGFAVMKGRRIGQMPIPIALPRNGNIVGHFKSGIGALMIAHIPEGNAEVRAAPSKQGFEREADETLEKLRRTAVRVCSIVFEEISATPKRKPLKIAVDDSPQRGTSKRRKRVNGHVSSHLVARTAPAPWDNDAILRWYAGLLPSWGEMGNVVWAKQQGSWWPAVLRAHTHPPRPGYVWVMNLYTPTEFAEVKAREITPYHVPRYSDRKEGPRIKSSDRQQFEESLERAEDWELVSCACGQEGAGADGLIGCDECGRWLHSGCVGPEAAKRASYVCWRCTGQQVQESRIDFLAGAIRQLRETGRGKGDAAALRMCEVWAEELKTQLARKGSAPGSSGPPIQCIEPDEGEASSQDLRVSQFLRSIDIPNTIADLFVKEAVSWSDLCSLEVSDLQEIGVESRAHQETIFRELEPYIEIRCLD